VSSVFAQGSAVKGHLLLDGACTCCAEQKIVSARTRRSCFFSPSVHPRARGNARTLASMDFDKYGPPPRTGKAEAYRQSPEFRNGPPPRTGESRVLAHRQHVHDRSAAYGGKPMMMAGTSPEP